jgi:hypothetical protein
MTNCVIKVHPKICFINSFPFALSQSKNLKLCIQKKKEAEELNNDSFGNMSLNNDVFVDEDVCLLKGKEEVNRFFNKTLNI